MSAMKVNEIFYSIQGESSFMGWPCAFIRLTACDLRCTYCDTEYAFFEGREMSVDQILHAVEPYPTRLALVTGGEPMLQKGVHALFGGLLDRGYTVALETGGHVSLKDVDPRVHKIMDLKCPSSGMLEHNDYGNIEYLTHNDEVKFVVGTRADFDWACEKIRAYNLTSEVGTVLFSPVYGELPYEQLARWVLDSALSVRLQLQLHKIIWPSIPRGV
jgi:7-carboxy-7-deazaguanine synthase